VFVNTNYIDQNMKYNNVDASLVNATLLVDHDDSQRSSPSSLQQNKILQKKLIRKYRLVLFILFILLLISLIILLVTILHKNRDYHINNSPVLLQASTCNYTNGTSINSSQ
jgi:hypothetical protein